MLPEDAVNATIAFMTESPDDDDDRLSQRLVDLGIERDIARRLLVLVPLAFSRAHCESVPTEKEYAQEFIVYDLGTETESSFSIATDPYFVAAANCAKHGDKSTVLLIAQRSPEYDAINKVLAGLPEGVVPKRIGTSPPVVECGVPRPRPWWTFW